jgi:hypothetical protein
VCARVVVKHVGQRLIQNQRRIDRDCGLSTFAMLAPYSAGAA